MSQYSDICFLTAAEMVAAIKRRTLSAHEVITAHLDRIETINPKVNAIVTLHAEQALLAAKAADEAQVHGETLGPLHGLPVAHKDLFLTKGMRTTFGSKIYEHLVPTENSLIVERQEQAGAITVGKTNTPEFGAGSQTFNTLFGVTRNPYDLSRTCGGSSGGSAVALATGMVALADGSDMFGSLRCPANYTNTVGLRPSVGRVPQIPALNGWDSLSVSGPMARTVTDTALYLSVMAGPDARDPLSITEDGALFRAPLERSLKGIRIALSSDMGGLPIDKQVVQVVERQRQVFQDLGCIVEDECPDFHDAHEIAMTLRRHSYDLNFSALMDQYPGVMKASIVQDIEEGRRLHASQLARVQELRTGLFQKLHRFMQTYEFMVFPVNQVPPFPVDQEYITEIDGVEMKNYIDWVRSLYYVTATTHPAISVPCSFTETGLPVGIQIVGRHRSEFDLLQTAYVFEQATRAATRRPTIIA